jgi:hypothetical protein
LILLTDVTDLELFVALIVSELGLRVRLSLRNDLEVELALDLANHNDGGRGADFADPDAHFLEAIPRP